MVYPLPSNEAARLRALHSYRILDTPFEQEYDDIVALAAEICGTPMAFITLIDDARQWFKARVGSDERQNSRELAFCAHAICRPDELMVVPDARADQRLANYPNVTCERGIRFYAGAPLVTPGGFALGTLCVADHEPRQLTVGQERALRVLRRHVVNALELRRVAHEQRDTIVALRETQDKLEEARNKAVALAETKGRFLATMSHEIRTPLSAVVGLARLLAEQSIQDPLQREAAESIRSSGELLLRLVNDLLDLAKIDSGRFELEVAPFPPHDSIRAAIELVRPAARDKGLHLATELAPTVPALVRGDATRLLQILVNLVSNAVKFTPAGRVTISASASPADDGRVNLHFAVRDTGIGLTPEQRARLFQEYAQADASTARQFGGTGLGLAIAKRLVELQGGSIHVESTPGQGSTFSFHIVVETADAHGNGFASTPLDHTFARHHPAKIIVAEDDPLNRRIVDALLTKLGYAPRLVGDGRAAITAWEEHGADLIFMDVEMPHLTGPDALQAIRARVDRPQPRVIMLTAHASGVDHSRFLRSGAEDCLTKPARIESLARVLAGPRPASVRCGSD